jgi:hypothetical protein
MSAFDLILGGLLAIAVVSACVERRIDAQEEE